MTPAAARVSRGSSSTLALASCFAVGSPAPRFTSRSVTSEGSTPSFAFATQRALKSSTVSSGSTSFTAAYCASGTSSGFTHTLMRGPAGAPADACE